MFGLKISGRVYKLRKITGTAISLEAEREGKIGNGSIARYGRKTWSHVKEASEGTLSMQGRWKTQSQSVENSGKMHPGLGPRRSPVS